MYIQYIYITPDLTQIDVSQEALRKMKYTWQCMLEAIRVHSTGCIARRVVKPLKIKVSE